ncbi:hypothetical protein, partial [Neisseria sp.]|uniref:hypothetical protein n=1 Tax=Neisseria sp. TaxID=192066 RepID=UPI0026DC1D6B
VAGCEESQIRLLFAKVSALRYFEKVSEYGYFQVVIGFAKASDLIKVLGRLKKRHNCFGYIFPPVGASTHKKYRID